MVSDAQPRARADEIPRARRRTQVWSMTGITAPPELLGRGGHRPVEAGAPYTHRNSPDARESLNAVVPNDVATPKFRMRAGVAA